VLRPRGAGLARSEHLPENIRIAQKLGILHETSANVGVSADTSHITHWNNTLISDCSIGTSPANPLPPWPMNDGGRPKEFAHEKDRSNHQAFQA
jgi:hypothetical protein